VSFLSLTVQTEASSPDLSLRALLVGPFFGPFLLVEAFFATPVPYCRHWDSNPLFFPLPHDPFSFYWRSFLGGPFLVIFPFFPADSFSFLFFFPARKCRADFRYLSATGHSSSLPFLTSSPFFVADGVESSDFLALLKFFRYLRETRILGQTVTFLFRS